jgi:hypothetical protein
MITTQKESMISFFSFNGHERKFKKRETTKSGSCFFTMQCNYPYLALHGKSDIIFGRQGADALNDHHPKREHDKLFLI